jgi:metal-responsive CopG/Arc/MetJ family transcriptional regulator
MPREYQASGETPVAVIGVSLPRKLIDRLTAEAKRRNVSRSALIAHKLQKVQYSDHLTNEQPVGADDDSHVSP